MISINNNGDISFYDEVLPDGYVDLASTSTSFDIHRINVIGIVKYSLACVSAKYDRYDTAAEAIDEFIKRLYGVSFNLLDEVNVVAGKEARAYNHLRLLSFILNEDDVYPNFIKKNKIIKP